MRLGLLEDGVEAAEVGPLVGVEGEDGKQRGHGLPVIPRERRSKGETPLFPGCFLDAFSGPFLPPVRPRLWPVRAVATVAKSSLSMSDSVFLKFAETDLLRRGSLDFADCREEEEMVEMGDSMGREAVESLREAGSCAPCPSGREGVSKKPETWRTREGVAEPPVGA